MVLLQDLNNEALATFTLFDKLSTKFFIRLAIDLIASYVLVRYIYLPNNRRREKVFTFLIFNLVIFLITYLLNKVEMSLGAAFGLFAVFAMLRYRTEDISTKDMTYLFLLIAVGLINAVSKGSWDELTLLMIILVVITYILEGNLLIKKEISKVVLYEKVELIRPEHRDQLIADLEDRLGIKINHVEIGKVDLLRDAAQIVVFYYE